MSFLDRLVDDPARVARLRRRFHLALGVIVLAEIVLPRIAGPEHPHFAFESFPAWGSIAGLLSCVAIVVVSKQLGKLWLSRREDPDGS